LKKKKLEKERQEKQIIIQKEEEVNKLVVARKEMEDKLKKGEEDLQKMEDKYSKERIEQEQREIDILLELLQQNPTSASKQIEKENLEKEINNLEKETIEFLKNFDHKKNKIIQQCQIKS